MSKQSTVYKAGEIKKLISEEVKKQYRIKVLKERMEKLQNELQILEENHLQELQGSTPNSISNSNSFYQTDNTQTETESESIFDSKPGETIIFNFQDVTIKAQRQLDDMFKIVDASESNHLKDGDYVKIRGNDILQKGRKFQFAIFREIQQKYSSNVLQGWKIIKNR